MRSQNYLLQKIKTHKISQIREIINNPHYFHYLFKEYNELETEPIPDFVLYAFHNIEEDYTSENYKDYLLLLNKIHPDYKKKLYFNELEGKYYAKDYLDIPTIKSLDEIFKKFDSIKNDFIHNKLDRYIETKSFIDYLKDALKSISYQPIKVDIINLLINNPNNEYLEVDYLFSKKSDLKKSDFDNWKGFKNILNTELKYLVMSITIKVNDYLRNDEYISVFRKKINNIITDGESPSEWKSIFVDKIDYDNFLEMFTLFAEKEFYSKKEIKINKNIKTKLFKKLRTIHYEISNEKLITDNGYFELIRCINSFKDFDDKILYKNLIRGKV